MQLNFNEPPELGTCIFVGKKKVKWRLVGSIPYTRRDGDKSAVLYWTDGFQIGATGLKAQRISIRKIPLTDDVQEMIISHHKAELKTR